jgi:hypothetical protein
MGDPRAILTDRAIVDGSGPRLGTTKRPVSVLPISLNWNFIIPPQKLLVTATCWSQLLATLAQDL